MIQRDGVRAATARLARPVAVLAACVCLAACRDEGAGGAPDERGSADAPAESGARLELVVEPITGDAPLAVRMRASVVGEDPDLDLGCATAAFTMGDGNVTHVRPVESPCPEGASLSYEVEHVYAAAGAFSASVRLIARAVPVSRHVQVLVLGATPTPVPMAAVPGPTIVIATSAPPSPAAPTSAAPSPEPSLPPPADAPGTEPTPGSGPGSGPGPEEGPTPGEDGRAGTGSGSATAPPVAIAATLTPDAGEPSSAAGAADSVLPADLYAVAAGSGALLRLPASGAALEAVVDGGTEAYAVSALDLVAVTRDGSLDIVSPTGVARTIADGEGLEPVWSRNGRRLAYAEADRLHVFDVVAFEDSDLGAARRPISFSRDGGRLLVEDVGGDLVVVDVLTGDRLRLPLPPAAHAGWLPDADVLWLSGPGLRFVALEPAVAVSTILGPEVETSAAFIRPDGHALVLAGEDGLTRLHAVDLAAAVPRAEAAGGPLPIDVGADAAWSPDGRWLAVAGSTGLILLDPGSGASVPLVDEAVRGPRWSIR